jgi:ABC-2 type transport system ATP-binding protein
VKKVSALPTDESAYTYELISDRDVDLRPEVFRAIADKGWVLLELHRDAQTLEDVFRTLTIGDERRNRRLTPDVDEGDEDDDETGHDDDGDGASRESAGGEKAASEERS